ncbi:MAG: hypothetical protein A2Z72_06250 [Omnitrophica bacterium RBG_13_46_9]|nr:MAG: hypothetical protein A2Z72_06250 [Omnitrophica bacterium RBG_13_46_9]
MSKVAYFVLAVIAISFMVSTNTKSDDEKEAYETQVPTGMELQQVGSKPGYRVVLPKGTAIRREGDLRIIEGAGEYASRKFVEYDALLDKMQADIASLQKDIEELKKTVSQLQKNTLVSK